MGVKKRPIRERVGGQFFGSVEDTVYEEDIQLESLSTLKDFDEEEDV
jgi:hypothetical protein